MRAREERGTRQWKVIVLADLDKYWKNTEQEEFRDDMSGKRFKPALAKDAKLLETNDRGS